MALNFDSGPYLELFRMRQQQEADRAEQPYRNVDSIVNGLQMISRNRQQQQLLDLQKGKAGREQAEHDYMYGKPIDPNIEVGQNVPQGTMPSLFSRNTPVRQPQAGQIGTGTPLIQQFEEWRAGGMKGPVRPEYVPALGAKGREEYRGMQELDIKGAESKADINLKNAQADFYNRRPSETEKRFYFVDSASRQMFDENMNPIDIAPPGAQPRILSDPYAGSEFSRRDALSQGAANSVSTAKSLLTPQVLGELKTIKFTPGKMYSQLASSEAKALYRHLFNAISNQLYLKTGATANPSEIENAMITYMPAANDDMADMVSRLDMLGGEAALFSNPRNKQNSSGMNGQNSSDPLGVR